MYATTNPALRVENNEGNSNPNPQNGNNVNNRNAVQVLTGYNRRQQGSLWIVFLLVGLASLPDILRYDFASFIEGIFFIAWAFGIMWNQVEDKGDHLLVQYGPCRWTLCGTGKEKIRYRNIKDYGITRSCAYGFGIVCCSGLKLFSICNCCCGHKVVRLTINERYQAEDASDSSDCCLESCCFKCYCGKKAERYGNGGCFRHCFNRCNANCCLINTVYISTNNADELLQLLNQKCPHIPVAENNINQQAMYANI